MFTFSYSLANDLSGTFHCFKIMHLSCFDTEHYTYHLMDAFTEASYNTVSAFIIHSEHGWVGISVQLWPKINSYNHHQNFSLKKIHNALQLPDANQVLEEDVSLWGMWLTALTLDFL